MTTQKFPSTQAEWEDFLATQRQLEINGRPDRLADLARGVCGATVGFGGSGQPTMGHATVKWYDGAGAYTIECADYREMANTPHAVLEIIAKELGPVDYIGANNFQAGSISRR